MVTVVQKQGREPIGLQMLDRFLGALAPYQKQKMQRDEQQYQRSLLQKSLNELKPIFKNQDLSPAEKMLAYEHATAGLNTGQGDRAHSQLIKSLFSMGNQGEAGENLQKYEPQGALQRQPLPSFLNQNQSQYNKFDETQSNLINAISNQTANNGLGLGQNPYEQPNMPQQVYGNQNVEPTPQENLNAAPIEGSMPQPELGATRSPSYADVLKNIPYKVGTNAVNAPRSGEVSNQFIPTQEIISERNKAMKAQKPPLTAEGLIEQNKILAADMERDLNLDAKVMSNAEQRNRLDDSWVDYSRTRHPEFKTNPEAESLFLKISSLPVVATSDSYAERFNKANQIYNDFDKDLKSMRDDMRRPNYIQQKYDNIANNIKQRARYYREIGLLGPYQEAVTSSGFGALETANWTEPLEPRTEKMLSEGPSYASVNKILNMVNQSDPFMTRSQKLMANQKLQEQKAYIDANWEQAFEIALKPKNKITEGGVFSPGENLLVIRDHFLQKEGNYEDFTRIIDNLVNSGRVELDPHQISQTQLTAQSPERAIGWWQWFLNRTPGYIPKY